MNARITATSFAVPNATQTAAELSPLIGKSAAWILSQTGVQRRHVSGRDEDDPACLAAEAVRPILAEHGAPDLLIYCGTIPRQMLPETSLFVHRELGLAGVPAFSINAACLSFLTALQTAESFIRTNSYKRILICCAELASRGRNFLEPDSAALLGDGAAAVLIEATGGDTSEPTGFQAYRMQTFSDALELTEVRGCGTKRPPDDPDIMAADHRFHMQGDRLLRRTVPLLKRFLTTFLSENNLTPKDIDLVVPHQPSGPGLNLLQRWGFPEDKIVSIIADYGNCVAASMPMALAIANQEGRIRAGDRVLFLGTAAGISIAGGLFRW